MAEQKERTPRPRRLKVFRTAIGFHDAYVAAPSRAAALKAWGTDKVLFAQCAAEEVTEPALMAEPLGAPGTILRKLRSSPEGEPSEKLAPRSRRKVTATKAPALPPSPPPPPRATAEAVDEAQAALALAQQLHEREREDLAAKERCLAEERETLEARQKDEIRQLSERLDAAEREHEAKLKAWKAHSAAAARGASRKP